MVPSLPYAVLTAGFVDGYETRGWLCGGESVRFGAVLGGWSIGIMRSRVRSAVLLAFMASAACASSLVMAQTPGDPAKGKHLANTCLGCHGVPNYKNAYPNY